MNESEFEEKLRSIKPVVPSPSLEARISRDLANAPGVPSSGVIPASKPSVLVRFLAPFAWAGAGAAVAVVTMLALDRADTNGNGRLSPNHPASVAIANPGNVEREMLDIADEGIFEDGMGAPSRLVRYTSVERRQWSEPNGAITLVEVPREDVVLVPVSFQ